MTCAQPMNTGAVELWYGVNEGRGLGLAAVNTNCESEPEARSCERVPDLVGGAEHKFSGLWPEVAAPCDS